MSENIRESLEKLSKVGTEDEQLLPRVLLRVLDEFDGVKTEIGEVKTGINGVNTEIGEVKVGINGLSAEIGEVKVGIDGISAEISEVKAGIDGVKTETGKVKTGIGEVNGEIKTKISEARTAQRKEIRIVGICTVIIVPLFVIAGIFWLSGQ